MREVSDPFIGKNEYMKHYYMSMEKDSFNVKFSENFRFFIMLHDLRCTCVNDYLTLNL